MYTGTFGIETGSIADTHLIILNSSVPLLQKDYFSPSHQFISLQVFIGNVECDNYWEYSVEKVHCVPGSLDREAERMKLRLVSVPWQFWICV